MCDDRFVFGRRNYDVSAVSRDESPPRFGADSAFLRAIALLVCGAFVCILFFASSLRGYEVADDAVAAAASVGIEEDAPAVAVQNDGSIWTYIEDVLRRLVSDAGD